MSVETVHQNMLNSISDHYDKSDGSFVYDLTKSVAIVVGNQGVKSDNTLDKLNVDNLTGDELTRFVYQRAGIIRKPATYASTNVTLTGAPNTFVEMNSLVAAETIFYRTAEDVTLDEEGIGIVEVTCVQTGVVGNVPVGAINSFPVTLSNITNVTNLAAVTNGYEQESDDVLRERYYDKLRRPGKAGNIYHYEEWAKSVIGVGKVKVYPLWNGPLTVKVVIVDANIEIPSTELLQDVSSTINQERPFGATVTVEGATALTINVSVDITVADGLTNDDVSQALKTKITNYLKSLAFEVDYVSRAQIGKIILETEGIVDYTELTLNNGTENVAIPDASIAVLGTVTLL